MLAMFEIYKAHMNLRICGNFSSRIIGYLVDKKNGVSAKFKKIYIFFTFGGGIKEESSHIYRSWRRGQ